MRPSLTTALAPLAVALLAALLLGACAGPGGPDGSGSGRGDPATDASPDGPATVEWRDLAVDVPAGWYVGERDERKLSMADAPLGRESSAEAMRAAIFLTWEPDTTADDWRELVAQRDGRIDEDEEVELAGAAATRLVFTMSSDGQQVREMVVVSERHEVVVLLQPVLLAGDRDGVELFERHRPTFEEVLRSVRPTGPGPVEALAAG